MKKINTILILAILSLSLGVDAQWSSYTVGHGQQQDAETQEKEYILDMSSGTLHLNDIHELHVVAYSGNKVRISSLVEKSESSDRAKGLKRLNADGLDDNTGFGISAVIEAGEGRITQLNNSCSCHDIKVEVPTGIKVVVDNSSMNGEYIKMEGISNEIEISTNYQDLHLKDITGPISAKTVYGEVEASFSKVNQEGAISIYSVYGYVDVSLPPSSKGNFKLSTPYGEIYSNVDIQIETDKSSKSHSGNKISGVLNGGGVDISLKAAYGDVFLRAL